MTRPRTQHPTKSIQEPKASTRPPHVRLISAVLLAAGALTFLGYRVYDTLVLSHPSERLFLADNVPLSPPPPLPPDDRTVLQVRLQSLESARKVVQSDPHNVTAQMEFARRAAFAGDFLSARAALLHALKPKPQANPEAEDALGHCLMELGLYTAALRTFQGLLRRFPENAALYINISRLQGILRQREDALRTLERGLKAVLRSDIGGRLALMSELEQYGDLRRTLAVAQVIHADAPDNPDTALAVARLLYKLLRLQEARLLLEKLVANYPDNNLARYYLASVIDSPLQPHRDRKFAEHILLETLQRHPEDLLAHERLGEMYMQQSRYRQAAYIFTRLLEITPDSASSRLQLANAYARLGDARMGAEQRAIAEKLLARDRAEARLITLRNQQPTNPQYRLALANHYIRFRQFGRAFAELQVAYALAPEVARIRHEWVQFYEKLGLIPPSMPGGNAS